MGTTDSPCFQRRKQFEEANQQPKLPTQAEAERDVRIQETDA